MFRTTRALLLFSIGLMASSVSWAEDVTLKVQHFLSEESLPHHALIEPWARRIEADSAGRIRVELYPSMTLGGKAPDLVDQVSAGSVDVIWTAAAYTPGRFPRSEVFTLPLVHRGDPVATNLAIMQSLDNGLRDDFAGLHPLLVHVQAGHALHLSTRPVVDQRDFEGLTLRPAGRGIGLWTIEALGAAPTKKRHPKLPKALAAHALDGAFMSFQLADTMGVIDAVGSHTLLEGSGYFGTSLYLFLMNQERYQSLPADLRTVIDRNSGIHLAKQTGQAWRQAEQAGIEAARASGNRFDILAGAPTVRALEQVVERWTKMMKSQQIDGPRLVEEARRAIARNKQAPEER